LPEEVVSVEVVRHFCHVATRRLGIEIDAKAKALVAGRVAKRLGMLQVPLDEYLNRLEDDKNCDEVVGFLDFVRPRAAGFFARFAEHAELHNQVRRWLRAGRRRLRLWSAGCGSGEEPYAMAITTLDAIEASGLATGEVDLKILASDISPRVLDRGKQGVFVHAQLREVPPRVLARYFTETEEGAAIAPELKSLIAFRRLNLAQPPYPMTGPLDAIFCREGLATLVPSARKRAFLAARSLLCEHGVFCPSVDDVDLEATDPLADDGLSHRLGHC
jgi:chemotaxis protein methyltransferase CheR